jgi:FkbM family methyltransferase
MGAFRLAIELAERAFGVRIVRPWAIALLFEQEHLRRFFEYFEVDCVFDVGANAGQYADMLRRHVGYKGTIISYEPIPELAAKMRTAARSDRCWFIEELALSNQTGTATFNISAVDQFSSLHSASTAEVRQFEQQTKINRGITVKTDTLENEIAKYQSRLGFRRPFLKMDTQGHDLAVAMGAGNMLGEFVGLQSELAIKRIYVDSPAYEQALEFFRNHGFELSAFVPNNAGHFPQLIETDCIMFRARPSRQSPCACR